MKHVKPVLSLTVTALSLVGVVAWVSAFLSNTFNPDDAPIGYVGMPAVSNHLLNTDNPGTTVNASSTRLYAIDYDSSEWSGNMHSYPLTSAGAVVKIDDWAGGFAAKLDVQNPTSSAPVPNGRFVFTRNDVTNSGAIFRWSGLSPAQRTALDPTISSTDGTKISKVLNYVRGERKEEGDGDKFRPRGSALGDIIHSTPVYCPGSAASEAPACGGSTVFVGANDGMLHAIDAATGTERWGFVPSMLIPKLPSLTAQNYDHQYFVDGRMDLKRVGTKSVLISMLGGGGKGMFALDVTNAVATTEADAATRFMWEIDNTTTRGCSGGASCFANLGYTYGQPVIATLQNGTQAVIVNNGYGATSGRAALFIIDALTGTLIWEIVMNDGGTTTQVNGLSSPTVIADTTGRASFAYAGDLNGNLWKIQLYSPYTASKLHTTTGGQAITMAPGIVEHPKEGYVVCFVTGRMLVPDDHLWNGLQNVSHYAYGIWDTPGGNDDLVDQVLTERIYTTGTTTIRVRTATSNTVDWNRKKGWRTKLPMISERVIGDGGFVTGTVFLFLTHNPSISATPPTPDGENWWMQLNALTGGDNGSVRFDLDSSGVFDAGDQITVGGQTASPVGRHMGGGRRSQLTALDGGTFNVYQANYDKNIDGVPTVDDSGVAGGHFDFDIYYFGTTTTAPVPFGPEETNASNPICAKTANVNNELNTPSPNYCKTNNGFSKGYTFMTSLSTGAACGQSKAKTNFQTIGCKQYTVEPVGGSYAKVQHTHEYDDKYDVTGVNMLNASDPTFNLVNAVPSTTLPFKILVMNQFLNPAATLTVGPGSKVTKPTSIKTYNDLASQTDPALLLAGLPIYTRGTTNTTTPSGATAYPITNFVYNMPLDGFSSRDWWGTGDGVQRAGLIPTQTGCVNGVSSTGVPGTPGPNGERANGALTFQLIRENTPATALEIAHNGNDVRFGWRVKAAFFTAYVLAEYTTFWHHGGKCYGDAGWIPNPAQDIGTGGGAGADRAPGSADPVGGSNGLGGTGGGGGDGTGQASADVVSTSTASNGDVTTRYSDGTVTIDYADGSTKITTNNGTVLWRIPGIDTGGVVNTSGSINLGGVTTPPEVLGRINWREVRR